jgi:ABC-2 type transport system permease protein
VTAVVAQTLALSRRSVIGTFRQPTVFIPGLLFPLMIAAVNNAALGRAVAAFPAPQPDSYLDFVMAATIVQGVLFGGVAGGSDLALDIEGGFFERLVASPVARPSILVGRLAGAAALGAVQVVVFVAVFLLFGAHVAGGIPAVLVLILFAVLLSIGIGGLAAAVALRTGSSEAVQNTFPLVFIVVFISGAFFPTALMRGWYRAVATHNPITTMIEGMRHQILIGFDFREAVRSLTVCGILMVLAIARATWQLQRRLAVPG